MTRFQKNRRLALAALMLALALVLSWLEQLIPVLPFLPPGVKLGLSNIAVMYCLFCLGLPTAALVAFLKALLVLLTRGVIAGLLSGAGAFCSLRSACSFCGADEPPICSSACWALFFITSASCSPLRFGCGSLFSLTIFR